MTSSITPFSAVLSTQLLAGLVAEFIVSEGKRKRGMASPKGFR
jgi:hypothetical protein